MSREASGRGREELVSYKTCEYIDRMEDSRFDLLGQNLSYKHGSIDILMLDFDGRYPAVYSLDFGSQPFSNLDLGPEGFDDREAEFFDRAFQSIGWYRPEKASLRVSWSSLDTRSGAEGDVYFEERPKGEGFQEVVDALSLDGAELEDFEFIEPET